MNQNKKIIRVQPLKNDPPPVLKQLNTKSSNLNVSSGRFRMSWPKVTQTIYPKQSIRVNTGWSTQQLGPNTSMTTFPHQSLISANMDATPKYYDQSNVGQQITQVVTNNNDFPVRVEVNIQENGLQTFTLLRLNNETLLSQEILQFDFGSLISGVVGVAQQVLPLVAML